MLPLGIAQLARDERVEFLAEQAQPHIAARVLLVKHLRRITFGIEATWRAHSPRCGALRRRALRARIGSTSCVVLAITVPL